MELDGGGNPRRAAACLKGAADGREYSGRMCKPANKDANQADEEVKTPRDSQQMKDVKGSFDVPARS